MFFAETLQQSLVLAGVTLCGFTDGYIFGQLPGMLAALQKESEGIRLTEDQISWIASIMNITCFIGYALGNVIIEKFGRKWSVSIMTAPVLITWITIYFAHDFVLLMLSRVTAGISFAGVLLTVIVCTAEYITPKTRGYSVCLMNAVAPAVGTATGHILGILLHWRTVALIGIVPSVTTIILSYFWVESPSWLAARGRFEECKVAFRILRGVNEDSEKELRLLIDLERHKLHTLNQKSRGVKLRSALSKSYFWKILTIGLVIAMFRTSCGKILFNTYAVTILEDITGSTDVLLFTLLIDLFIVIGTILSCILVHKVKMRRIILPTSLLAVFFLVCLSAGLYFKPENNYLYSWINSLLMAIYFIAIYVSGSALENYHSEICPLEIKPEFFSLLAIINSILIFTSIKLATPMFDAMGYHGVFLLNAALLLLCVLYLWKYLPETSGRTLQEIELYFKTNSFDNADIIWNGEQIKDLI